jgi:hypothetical protein
MRIAFSRSPVLAAITAVVVLSTVPSAIRRAIRSGDPYLFTERFFEDMWARFSGPGRLRFILQPSVAILLGVRDGRRDSQTKCPPLLSWQAFRRAHGPKLWRDAVSSVSDLVAIAIILDLICQALILRRIHPGAALLLGPLLIAIPYSVSRTLANRIASWRAQEVQANRPM